MPCPGCEHLNNELNKRATLLEIYEYACNKLKRLVWLGFKGCNIITPPDCPLIKKDSRTEEERMIDEIWKV